MIDDDDIPQDVQRGVEKALFGGGRAKSVVVETKRSGKPRPIVEAKAKLRPLNEPGDESFTVSFHAVLPDGRRAHLKTLRIMDPSESRAAIREYEAEGRIVRWIGKRPEDYTEDDFDAGWA